MSAKAQALPVPVRRSYELGWWRMALLAVLIAAAAATAWLTLANSATKAPGIKAPTVPSRIFPDTHKGLMIDGRFCGQCM